jgi:hypothetical protein
MKSIQNFIHLPHINPIYRDLALVAGAGLLIAMAVITLAVMIGSQI